MLHNTESQRLELPKASRIIQIGSCLDAIPKTTTRWDPNLLKATMDKTLIHMLESGVKTLHHQHHMEDNYRTLSVNKHHWLKTNSSITCSEVWIL